MVELEYTAGLKPAAYGHAGSIPAGATNSPNNRAADMLKNRIPLWAASLALLLALGLSFGARADTERKLINGIPMTKAEHHAMSFYLVGRAWANVYKPKLNSFTTEQLNCMADGLRAQSWEQGNTKLSSEFVTENEKRCTGKYLDVPEELLQKSAPAKPQDPGV